MTADISIIIPAYNAEQCIAKCIASIACQDTAGVSIECIIVNDCSTDRCVAVAQEAIAASQSAVNFRVVTHERNQGVSAARNTGVAKATGTYVLFIDADDYLLPGSLAYFAGNIAQYPDADIIVGGFRENDDGASFFRHIDRPLYLTDRNEFTRLLLNSQIYLQSWNKLVRRTLLTEGGIQFIRDIIYEDIPWNYDAFSRARSVLILPRDTYIYNYVETSLIHTIFDEAKAKRAVSSCITVASDMLSHPPASRGYNTGLTVEYLLCMAIPLNQGVDILMRTPIPATLKREFLSIRLRLLREALAHGRLIVALFLLLMFAPLCHLQKVRLFRKNYHRLQQMVRQLSHKTDFIHR